MATNYSAQSPLKFGELKGNNHIKILKSEKELIVSRCFTSFTRQKYEGELLNKSYHSVESNDLTRHFDLISFLTVGSTRQGNQQYPILHLMRGSEYLERLKHTGLFFAAGFLSNNNTNFFI